MRAIGACGQIQVNKVSSRHGQVRLKQDQLQLKKDHLKGQVRQDQLLVWSGTA
jgi:hypothetical protein